MISKNPVQEAETISITLAKPNIKNNEARLTEI
jgi:hypothetical protein